ncbi:hydrogenase 4 subunit F [Candidatus Azambacteria bacterium]|nr:hydrogenase 4 subunit F [Candidatus Azambacteria bacterium]
MLSTILIIPFLTAIVLLTQVEHGGAIFSPGKMLMADALSAYLVGIVSLVAFIAILYSVGYIGEEFKSGIIGMRRVRQYYALTQLFICTMLLALLSNNLAVMWVAIEGTTLATAFLISFYNNEKTIEAAWKYLIICTVGITLALFGTILVYYASLRTGANVSDVLLWSSLVLGISSHLDPELIKIAFIFIFVGYGTKVGLAPFHTWLPDAHGRAPTPISALMSGVLLNVALYSILRFKVITDDALGNQHFTNTLFVIFGFISIFIASFIILVARKYKRLFAYSSIEHMGIITLGIGFGHPLSVLGALWHVFNHAMTKSMLFFTAGNILLKYHTGAIARVSGMIRIIPVTSLLFIFGLVAIVGLPPFSIFFSELLILAGGFAGAYAWIAASVLLLFVVVFAGFFYHVNRMLFGDPPEGTKPGEVNRFMVAPIFFNLAVIVGLGIFLPGEFSTLLEQIRNILQ